MPKTIQISQYKNVIMDCLNIETLKQIKGITIVCIDPRTHEFMDKQSNQLWIIRAGSALTDSLKETILFLEDKMKEATGRYVPINYTRHKLCGAEGEALKGVSEDEMQEQNIRAPIRRIIGDGTRSEKQIERAIMRELGALIDERDIPINYELLDTVKPKPVADYNAIICRPTSRTQKELVDELGLDGNFTYLETGIRAKDSIADIDLMRSGLHVVKYFYVVFGREKMDVLSDLDSQYIEKAVAESNKKFEKQATFERVFI